jgi:hypothetical protein
VKPATIQRDVAKHPNLSCLSRLRPNPLGYRPAAERPLAVVPALRPAPVAFSARYFGRPLAYAAAAIICGSAAKPAVRRDRRQTIASISSASPPLRSVCPRPAPGQA